MEEGPIIALLSDRIKSKNKRLKEICRLERRVKDGHAMSIEQQNRIDRKGDLNAELKELEYLKNLLPGAIAEEIHKNSITLTNTGETEHDSEGTVADETSSKNESVAVENGDAQADATESAKNAEVDIPSITQNVAQVELDQKVVKRVYNFFKRYRLEGDDKPFYHGDAMALVSRRSMRIQYSDLYKRDKRLAMEICAHYERLMPSMIEAAKRFCTEILKNTIKSSTRQKANAINANLNSLKLIVTGKPKSHQMLGTILQPRSVLLVDVEVQSDNENPMKTPSDLGASFLMGTIEDLIGKHMQGLSCNGKFGLGNVEVYNGEKYFINSPLVKHSLGSEPWAEACQKDFKCYSDSFPPLFKTGDTYPPYMAEFRAALATVPLHVLRNRAACLAFHEFVLDHMAAKPIPVRAALVSGIHNCCKSYDLNDPEAPFKTIIHEMNGNIPGLGLWIDTVDESGNELMKKFLTKKVKNGREPECKFSDDLESMSTYLRVLYEHGSDYTKDKKKKNQGKMRNSSNQNQNRWVQNQNQNRWAQNQNRQNQNQYRQNQNQYRQNQNQNWQNQNQYRQNQNQNWQNQNQYRQNQNQNWQNQNQNQNQQVQNLNRQNQNQNQQVQNQNRQNQNQNQNQQVQNPNQNVNELDDDEPQLQRLKKLDELELIGARHLGKFVLELIYKLLKNNAMKGMMLPIWKAYKSSKISNERP